MRTDAPDWSAGGRCRARRRYPRSRTLGTVCPPTRVHDMEHRERPEESRQSVPGCWRKQTVYLTRHSVWWKYVISCTWIKDRTCEWYYVWIDISKYMPEMDMMICEPWSGLGRSQLGAVSLNIIGRTNEHGLYVIVIRINMWHPVHTYKQKVMIIDYLPMLDINYVGQGPRFFVR